MLFAGSPKSEDFLLVATRDQPHIYQIGLNIPASSAVSEIQTTPGTNPIALDYDHYNKLVFWSDVSEKKILKASLFGGPATVVKHLLPSRYNINT